MTGLMQNISALPLAVGGGGRAVGEAATEAFPAIVGAARSTDGRAIVLHLSHPIVVRQRNDDDVTPPHAILESAAALPTSWGTVVELGLAARVVSIDGEVCDIACSTTWPGGAHSAVIVLLLTAPLPKNIHAALTLYTRGYEETWTI